MGVTRYKSNCWRYFFLRNRCVSRHSINCHLGIIPCFHLYSLSLFPCLWLDICEKMRHTNYTIHCPLGVHRLWVFFPLFAIHVGLLCSLDWRKQIQLCHPARMLNACPALVDRSWPHTETDLQTNISKCCSFSVETKFNIGSRRSMQKTT